MKYDRGNLDSAIIAAKKLAKDAGRTTYVFATSRGYDVALEPPPFNQAHYRISSDGNVVLWKSERERRLDELRAKDNPDRDRVVMMDAPFDWRLLRLPGEFQGDRGKPSGLWYSLGTEWIDWCIREEFRGITSYIYKLTLDMSKILQIRTPEELVRFTDEYKHTEHTGYNDDIIWIKWALVARKYSGIEIAPAMDKFLLLEKSAWYYGWDIASGCIWDKTAILKIELISKEAIKNPKPGMVTRFYKNTRYIGVNFSAKDTMGEWRKEINLKSFYGRPYNRFMFDEIYEYTPEIWQSFVDKATEQAKATNREVFQGEDFLYLCPIWIHGVKKEAIRNPENGYYPIKKDNLDDLIQVAYKVTANYPQRWGDCYKVNSTVAEFLRKYTKGHEFEIWQVTADIYTGKHKGSQKHVVLNIDKEDYDFSNLLDNEDYSIVTYDSKLYGEIDNKLLDLLEREEKP